MILTPTETSYVLKTDLKKRKSKESTVDHAMVQFETGPRRKPWNPDWN